MGATFKENVTDIRNSKVADVVKELQSFSCHVDVTDPHADGDEVKHEYGYTLAAEMKGPYDAIVVAVNHSEYANKDEAWFKSMMTPKGVLVDLKGIFRTRVKDLTYWSL
jgi:UDP-N-acetyl-D-galactosamine dehydrogenase